MTIELTLCEVGLLGLLIVNCSKFLISLSGSLLLFSVVSLPSTEDAALVSVKMLESGVLDILKNILLLKVQLWKTLGNLVFICEWLGFIGMFQRIDYQYERSKIRMIDAQNSAQNSRENGAERVWIQESQQSNCDEYRITNVHMFGGSEK